MFQLHSKHFSKPVLGALISITQLLAFFALSSPAHAAQETEMVMAQQLGYPLHRDFAPLNHVMVKKVDINGNTRITISPFDKPNAPWLEFAEEKNVNQLVDSKNTFYTLISGHFMALHPTQPGQAITVQQNTLLTRIAEQPDGSLIMYMGDPSHVDESKAPRFMETPYFTTFVLKEADLANYKGVQYEELMADPKAQEGVLKAHFDKVNNQDLAALKIPSKGKLHSGSVAKQSIKLAKRIAEQDGQKMGTTHVVSDGWSFKKHAITGVPLYRYANVAFTQKNKNGKCMLLGFQIRQDYDGRGYNNMVYSKNMLRNPPYNQYMSCKNL